MLQMRKLRQSRKGVPSALCSLCLLLTSCSCPASGTQCSVSLGSSRGVGSFLCTLGVRASSLAPWFTVPGPEPGRQRGPSPPACLPTRLTSLPSLRPFVSDAGSGSNKRRACHSAPENCAYLSVYKPFCKLGLSQVLQLSRGIPDGY